MSDSAIIILRAKPETLEQAIGPISNYFPSIDNALINKGLISLRVKDFASGRILITLQTVLDRFDNITPTIVHDIESSTPDYPNLKGI